MTPMTLTEKILARHAGRASVTPGDNVWIDVDVLMTHDVCGPGTIGVFKRFCVVVVPLTVIVALPLVTSNVRLFVVVPLIACRPVPLFVIVIEPTVIGASSVIVRVAPLLIMIADESAPFG